MSMRSPIEQVKDGTRSLEVSIYNATVVDIEVTNLNGKYCRLQVCFV